MHAVYSIKCALQSVLYKVCCTECALQSVLYKVCSTKCTVEFTVHTTVLEQFWMLYYSLVTHCSPHIFNNPHFSSTPHSTLHYSLLAHSTPHIFNTPLSTLHTSLLPEYSTLHTSLTLPSTGYNYVVAGLPQCGFTGYASEISLDSRAEKNWRHHLSTDGTN